MIHPLDAIYGHILMADKKLSIELFQRINSKWCKTVFHERMYSAIESLISKDREIDLVTVMQEFRNKGWTDKGIAAQISSLTNFNDYLEARIAINSLFDELALMDAISLATSFRNQFDNHLQNGSLSIEKYNEIVEGLKLVSFNRENAKETIGDVIDSIVLNHAKAQRGEKNWIELPYQALQRVVSLEPVDVMLVAARPGMGKTAFMVSSVCEMLRQKTSLAVFSLEMSSEQILRRCCANLLGIDSNKIKYGTCTPSEIAAIHELRSNPIFDKLVIYDGSHTLSEISMKISEAKKTHNIECVFIDYIQKITPMKASSQYQELTDISNGVKRMTMNMRIPTIALAQLSRAEKGSSARPRLSDLRGSGELEQDASIVMFLHRPEYYNESVTLNGTPANGIVEFLLAKNREGKIGNYELGMSLETSKIYG